MSAPQHWVNGSLEKLSTDVPGRWSRRKDLEKQSSRQSGYFGVAVKMLSRYVNFRVDYLSWCLRFGSLIVVQG